MSSTVTVKRGDIGVLFSDSLTADGFDFAGATVHFLLSLVRTGALAVTGTATLANPAVGTVDVSYTTTTGDLDVAGVYRQEWEVTKGGNRLTFPNDGWNQVKVIDDLGDT